jgi:hypothetical protein
MESVGSRRPSVPANSCESRGCNREPVTGGSTITLPFSFQPKVNNDNAVDDV